MQPKKFPMTEGATRVCLSLIPTESAAAPKHSSDVCTPAVPALPQDWPSPARLYSGPSVTLVKDVVAEVADVEVIDVAVADVTLVAVVVVLETLVAVALVEVAVTVVMLVVSEMLVVEVVVRMPMQMYCHVS
jgi:hypothetical protein